MRPGRVILDAAREAVRGQVREVERELTRPWREGRPGAAAEVGRWLGLGLAVGAAAAGVAAALWAARGRPRRGSKRRRGR